ncbi:MAG: hypothetical protein LBH81_01060 [Rickettsiales bacterium]|jgi:hypothetical protein|nr:hypothetical protein [Rickettsiales bacterium]
MEPAKILQEIRNIADNQALLNEEAMSCAQKINLNGLKRMHRHLAKKFQCHGICVANFAMDLGMDIKKPGAKGGYVMKDLKDHLTKFSALLEKDIASLKSLNGEFIKVNGMEFKEGVCMQECLVKKWSKVKFRWLPRFEFTKWDAMDIMNWDKWLHDKIRCLEEGK